MPETPLVSVIIITYNRSDTLAKAMNSIFAQDYPESLRELIVVDDGSTDGTQALINRLRTLEPLNYIRQEHKNPASARNAGIKNARGEIICFLDSDCIAPLYWLSTIATLYNRHPETLAVGGWWKYVSGKKGFLGRAVELIFYRPAPGIREGFLNSLATRNLSFRKEIFQKIGYFDEKLGYPEDTDFNLRLNACGYKIYYSEELTVQHLHPFGLVSCYRREFITGQADYKLHLRYPGTYLPGLRLPDTLLNAFIFCAAVFIKPILLMRGYRILRLKNLAFLPFFILAQVFRKAGIYCAMARMTKDEKAYWKEPYKCAK